MKRIAIIGAGGHGRVLADIARLNGYTDIIFLDDNLDIHKCGRYAVIGTSSAVENIDADIAIGIGNAEVRKRILQALKGKPVITLIHPNAVIADDVHIGNGSVIMAGAVINPGVIIGEGCIINTCASVDHDCKLGNYVHIAIGSHLCGTVTIGNETWIGAGATVINNVHISSRIMIGAGAVVIRDANEPGMYVGVPAKKIR